MKTITVSYTYNIKFNFNGGCVTECGKVINTLTGKELKQFLNGSKKAVYIKGKAVNIEDLTPLINEIICPF